MDEELLEHLRGECRVLIDNLTITNDDFYDQVFLAGGAIRSLMLGEPVKDVDLWLPNKDLVGWLETHISGFISSNAINFHSQGMEYQIITRNTAPPEEMIDAFDFKMNQNYYSYKDDKLVIRHPESIRNMTLDVNPDCRNKIGTLARIAKFVARGYKLPSRIDLLRLGVGIAQNGSIDTFDQLEDRSQLFLSEKDFDEIDFVERPLNNPTETLEAGVAFMKKHNYGKTRSGQAKLRGSSI